MHPPYFKHHFENNDGFTEFLAKDKTPPKARIGFPRGNDKRGWSGLDEELKQGLKKSLKDGSVKSFSDFIYNKCIERFGVVPVKRPQEKKDSDASKAKRKRFAVGGKWLKKTREKDSPSYGRT